MASDVHIVSSTLPRYFPFGTVGTTTTTTTQQSLALFKESPYSAFQAIVSGTGAVSATVVIYGSLEDTTAVGTNSNWVTLGTISVTGTTSASDGFTTIAPWRWVAAKVTAISGTGATVKVIMGS